MSGVWRVLCDGSLLGQRHHLIHVFSVSWREHWLARSWFLPVLNTSNQGMTSDKLPLPRLVLLPLAGRAVRGGPNSAGRVSHLNALQKGVGLMNHGMELVLLGPEHCVGTGPWASEHHN